MLKQLIGLVMLCLSLSVQANELKVTLLGTGTPRPDINHFGPATLIQYNNKNYLFDVGRGATIRLQQLGIKASEIEALFLTHLHSDHISGFDDLWLTGWIWQRAKVLQVFGPEGTTEFVKHMRKAYAKDIQYRAAHSGLDQQGLELRVKSYDEDRLIFDQDGLRVTAFKVSHGAVEPAFGYRIETEQHSLVISGDTTVSENLLHHAQDVDVLIHELVEVNPALYQQNKRLQRIASYHTSLEQAWHILDTTRPKLTVFNHLLLLGVDKDRLEKKVRENSRHDAYLGQDLMMIKIGQSISVHQLPFISTIP